MSQEIRTLKLLRTYPPDMRVSKVIETTEEFLKAELAYMPRPGTQMAGVLLHLGNAWLGINGRENEESFRFPETITRPGITRAVLSHSTPALASMYCHRMEDRGILVRKLRRVVGHFPLIQCWELTPYGWRCWKKLKEHS